MSLSPNIRRLPTCATSNGLMTGASGRTAARMASLIGVLALIGATAAQADPVLYSIAPDANGVGRVLTQVDVLSPGAGVALGDGSSAFNGGLAYRSSSLDLFAIANDANGLSSLLTVDPTTGATGSSVALGSGFTGGLAFDGTNTLHAIGADSSGISSLYSIVAASGATTSLGALGYGFSGLAFDTKNSSFYSFASDAYGVPDTFEQIALTSAGPIATPLFTLGVDPVDGDTLAFNGGLAYDPANDDFLAIGNDFYGNSTLYSFDLAGDSLTTVQALGGGYVNASLAFAEGTVTTPPPGEPTGTVPEPATPLLLAGAVLTLGRRFRFPHRPFNFISRRAS